MAESVVFHLALSLVVRGQMYPILEIEEDVRGDIIMREITDVVGSTREVDSCGSI